MPLATLRRLLQRRPAPAFVPVAAAVDEPRADAADDSLLHPVSQLQLIGDLHGPESEPAFDPPAPLPSAARDERERAYLRWLFGWPAQPRKLAAPLELVLASLDPALATPDACGRLLRRAPNVVPRLVQTLNSDVYSRAEVVQQVERDPVLTTEVLRVARSVLYRRESGRAPSIATAVGLLGSSGLKQVIHRALVRPLYAAEGNSLQARAATRLWDESERCARQCVALARERGVDVVDAYLAGLLHNTGWSAVLQALDSCGLAGGVHQGLLDPPGAAREFMVRHDRALSRLLVSWNLSPELTGLACDLGARTPASPLAQVLAEAQEHTLVRRVLG